MLTQIVREFRISGGAVSLNELSLRLRVERSALDGMMETLVHQGKIREVCAAEGNCSCGSCHCGKSGAQNVGKAYQLITG